MTAISEYFRTALVIDDRVEGDYSPLEELRADETVGVSGEPQPDLAPPPADGATPVHPSALVNAFMRGGIVCGVLQPDQNEPGLAILARKGARIADLLILDWLLFGDDNRTIEMISAVAEANKGRLTVVVIFTGTHDLRRVVERLTDTTDFEETHDFVLQCEDTVVLVFGKPGITLVRGENRRTAEYRDLPARIRYDLETIFAGLMPQFVFRGVNAVRDSTPRNSEDSRELRIRSGRRGPRAPSAAATSRRRRTPVRPPARRRSRTGPARRRGRRRLGHRFCGRVTGASNEWRESERTRREAEAIRKRLVGDEGPR